ncbi:MAG: GNAT family N-acetyltransferase [Chloroflexi bacterium]|nr:GNAT family N-acetyltransferase [Chloroflexota bacterium]
MSNNTPAESSLPPFDIVRGIPPMYQRQAAEIYYEAFRQKLTPILGEREQAVELLTRSMRPANAFAAVRDERLLGLVGFHYDGQQLIDVRLRTLVETFGWLQGTRRALIGLLVGRTPKRGELLLDGIAVHADARGQGVGSRLFAAIFAFAAEQGCTQIRLDVVDSNPRARQLYERLGFVAAKTARVPFMQPMGFTAVTTMTLDLQKAEGDAHDDAPGSL